MTDPTRILPDSRDCKGMDNVEEVKLGFLGLGWPGEQHAKAAASLPGTSVYAACDLSGRAAR